MSQHLSYPERCIIERLLNSGKNYAEIARQIERSKSTVMREVKKNVVVFGVNPEHNNCANFIGCQERYLCDYGRKTSCFTKCKNCTQEDCSKICTKFRSYHCDKLEKPPYVCNGCINMRRCQHMQHRYYIANKAEFFAHRNWSDSRKGIRTDSEALKMLNLLLTPLVKQGQSVNHILAAHANEIGLSEKTIYNYIDSGLLDVRNIDLPKKVAYRIRRKKIKSNAECACRKGRSYEEFNKYVSQEKPRFIVEMDTVKSKRGSSKTLLTMIFRETSFMLIFLMPDGTQDSVTEVFDYLTDILGLPLFKKLFPVILTDNGPEFKNPEALEFTERGTRRTNIFYCDPLASWQKPHVENNHKLIRRILPKGTSFENLTQKDVNLIANHINSVAREIYENETPFDRLDKRCFRKLLERLDLQLVPPDSVNLTPNLIKK